jgi:hypothetical protein
LQPGLVLFCLFPGNDLNDAERFDQWLKAGAGTDYRLWRGDAGDGGAVSRLRGLLMQSYLVTLLRDARRKVSADLSGRTMSFADGSRLELAPAIYARNELMAQPDHPNFRLVLDAAERARALAEQNGSHFLVLLMPTKEEVYLPLLGERPPPGVAPFIPQFEALGIPYFDLTPPLQAHARDCASRPRPSAQRSGPLRPHARAAAGCRDQLGRAT